MANNEHDDLIGEHKEKFNGIERRISTLEISSKEIIELGKQIIAMRAELRENIAKTSSHVDSGGKWRLAISMACIGLIGVFINNFIEFGIIKEKVKSQEMTLDYHKKQLDDLNYAWGKIDVLVDKK